MGKYLRKLWRAIFHGDSMKKKVFFLIFSLESIYIKISYRSILSSESLFKYRNKAISKLPSLGKSYKSLVNSLENPFLSLH